MAIAWPTSPVDGQQFQATAHELAWTYSAAHGAWLQDPTRPVYAEITGFTDPLTGRDGPTVSLSPVFHGADGSTSTPSSPPVTWSASGAPVASISSAGVLDLNSTDTGSVVVSIAHSTYSSLYQTRRGTLVEDQELRYMVYTVTPWSYSGGPTRQMLAFAVFTNGTITDVTSLCTWSPTPYVSNTAGTKGLITPPTTAFSVVVEIVATYSYNDPWDGIGSARNYQAKCEFWTFPNAP